MTTEGLVKSFDHLDSEYPPVLPGRHVAVNRKIPLVGTGSASTNHGLGLGFCVQVDVDVSSYRIATLR
jgi:hypothetical protein